jgi:hypothetical protein
MNLGWMNAVEVASLTFFTLPVTLNSVSSKIVTFWTLQPASVSCLPIVKALPGVTSRGAFLSPSAR